MGMLVAASAAAVGLGLSVVLAKAALSALLVWTYSGMARESSAPSGVRSRTPELSSVDRRV
jgi:hypothetical protein